MYLLDYLKINRWYWNPIADWETGSASRIKLADHQYITLAIVCKWNLELIYNKEVSDIPLKKAL